MREKRAMRSAATGAPPQLTVFSVATRAAAVASSSAARTMASSAGGASARRVTPNLPIADSTAAVSNLPLVVCSTPALASVSAPAPPPHGALGSRFHGPHPLLPPLAPPWTNAEGGARAEYGEEEGDARADDGEEERGVGVARCPTPSLLPPAAAAACRTATVEP